MKTLLVIEIVVFVGL